MFDENVLIASQPHHLSQEPIGAELLQVLRHGSASHVEYSDFSPLPERVETRCALFISDSRQYLVRRSTVGKTMR